MKEKKGTHLIGVNQLQEIVKYVVVSGFLKNHKPLSLLLIGEVGTGKSEIIMSFKGSNIDVLSDISYIGIVELMKEMPNLTHIIIPDLTKITMKQKSTSDNVLTCINALTEEGLQKIRLFGIREDFKGRRAGVITATTSTSFAMNRRKLESFGLTSRFLLCSFRYSAQKKVDIMESIYKCEYLQKQYVPVEIKKANKKKLRKDDVIISPEIAKKINHFETNTFRTQKMMQTLACAIALSNGRKAVTQDDVETLKNLNGFMNLEYNTI